MKTRSGKETQDKAAGPTEGFDLVGKVKIPPQLGKMKIEV